MWTTLAVVLAASGVLALPVAADARGATSDVHVAAKKKATKKKAKAKKKCKKTHVLRKGKCVKRKAPTKPNTPVKPTPPAPPNLSDADGDGIPYAWEVAAAGTPANPKPVTPKRCTSKQRLVKGKCVKRCAKGRVLRRGKCVKRKKAAKRKPAARKSAISPASVAPLGANPNHKDVFVEIDYASEGLRQNVACSELDAIVDAFANAPVSNPDGKPGIALHIDAGVVCPSRSYKLGGSRIMDAGPCPTTNSIFNWIGANFSESRIGTFHVAGFSPTACGGGGEGGAGDLGGTKMSVFTDGASFAHVLMHELGHNLGLDHPFPGQPNRISTMNSHLYRSPTGSSGNTVEVLDFQRFDIPALDESNLSEEAGISAPPEAHDFYVWHHCAGPPSRFEAAWPGNGAIDWNCNTPPFGTPVIDPGTVSADVNGDGQLSVFPATGNEWLALSFRSGGEIGPR